MSEDLGLEKLAGIAAFSPYLTARIVKIQTKGRYILFLPAGYGGETA